MNTVHNISQITETDGVSTYFYKLVNENNKTFLKQTEKTNKKWQSLKSFFTDVFLPHGYPSSVSKDYLQYQIWDSIQAFASSITGSICTHAVLKGAGVGDENASALAATITWLMKDGTSMVGRITFAWLKGTKLDSDCKKWRLFADVINDLAMFLDLLSAYFQNHFTLIICFSGLIKSIVGVAGGSTRAALTQHQARKNNMADVSAKDGSQETLVNLLALICSIIWIPIVIQSFLLTWLIYTSMTIVHLTANYFAVRSVVMETFNSARFKIFARHYFSKDLNTQSLSIDEVNNEESVFFSMQPKEIDIRLGSSFRDIIEDKSPNEIENILNLYKDCDYMLTCTIKQNDSRVIIKAAFNRKATVITEIEAMYQACCLEHMLKDKNMYLYNNGYLLHDLAVSRKHTRTSFNDFLNNVKSDGFNINAAYFNTDKWKVDW